MSMDIVVQYLPPAGLVSPRQSSPKAEPQEILEDEIKGGLSIPSADVESTSATPTVMQSETDTNASSDVTTQQGGLRNSKSIQQGIPASNTFNRAVEISLMEPVGSMSISPANRDVVLAARKGLFILDLENPYDQPRFLPHMTTWVPADVQWNPHPARANWVASTSNNKLLVWNLDRPAAYRPSILMPASVKSGTTLESSSNPLSHFGVTPSGGLNGTLPHVPGVFANSDPSVSRSSSISHVLSAHTRAITDINWNPFHPEILASCGIDSWMWAWDLREPSRPKQGYSAWNAAMTQVKWNRASPHRLATSCDNKVLIWDDRKGALPLASIEAARSRIYGIDWSRDTSLGLSRLVTCSLDGSVKWWDLDSPAAQAAIGERRLVTEAETTIETHTPVWRARHLPFGNGVMTLPQRGDTSLCMWAKDRPDDPVHRFEGHRDIVKEYLIRTQGGSDRERDDRRFQLITWSKDQTLRLWPISEEMMEGVGHKKGAPIRVLQTRRGAPDVTYRVPPATSIEGDDVVLSTSPDGIGKSMSSASTGLGIAPPINVTHSVLSGSSGRGGGRGNGITMGSPVAITLSPADQKSQWSTSFGNTTPISTSVEANEHRRNSFGMSHLSVNIGKRTATASSGIDGGPYHSKKMSGSGKMTLGTPRVSGLSSSYEQRVRQRDDMLKRDKPKRKKEMFPDRGATQNFMTRGTGMHAGQGRYGPGGRGRMGKGAALDAVGWIAGVRMGDEEKTSSKRTKSKGQPSIGADEDKNVEKEEIPHRDASQVLGEEIKSVSKNANGATFEKIDVSTRVCTLTCYGPWAGKNVACFLRITLTFPSTYPAKPPKFDLEHNASVSLKTRAYLLRKLNSLLLDCSQRQPPEPSMQDCLTFLQEGTIDDSTADAPHNNNFWLPSDDSEDEEQQVINLKMPAPRCGASFGPNGMLVTFAASNIDTALQSQRPSIALAAELQNALSVNDPMNEIAGKRFFQSYIALSGAMTSLARLAKEGMAVKHLDVVQLMADENFFAKRIQQEQKATIKGIHQSSKGDRSSSKAPHARMTSHNADRLDYIRSTVSRPSTSRPGRRTRSASPAIRARESSARSSPRIDSRLGLEEDRHVSEAKSNVRIWNIGTILPSLLNPPPMLRKRSSSMPSSPAATTPRAERSFILSSLDDPSSLAGGDARRRKVAETSGAGFAASTWIQDGSDEEEEEGSDQDKDYEGSDNDDDEPNAASVLDQNTRDGMHPVVEKVFDTIIWTMPFGFLLLMMDIMIQQQYGTQPTFIGEISRLIGTIPILTAFIYYTSISPALNSRRLQQVIMFAISTASGCSFLYIYSRSPMDIVVRRISPLGTLWVYTLIKLDLSPVLLSLSIVYLYTVRYDLPILS